MSRSPLPERQLIDLYLRDHRALDEIAHWSGHPADLGALRTTAAVARTLAVAGYYVDGLGELAKVDAVLTKCVANPGLTGVSQADLAPLRWLVAYAAAQRDAATTGDYKRALDRVLLTAFP